MLVFFTEFVPKYLPRLLGGAVVTLELCFFAMICGMGIGLLCAIVGITGGPIARNLVKAYVSICRGVPLIVILLFIFFTLPDLNIRLTAFWAGVVGLSFNLGAYLSEVFRAAILAIDGGQMQAGLSLGLNRFLIYRNRVETETDILVGKREDTLRRDGDEWRITRRKIILDQNVLLSKNLTFFF